MKMLSKDIAGRIFQAVSAMGALSALFVLAVYARMGWFARPLADDYCQSDYLAKSQNIFEAIFIAYNAWLNSYSILFFTQLIESGGIWGFRLMSGVTILFWVITTTWLMVEIGRTISFRLSLTVWIWFAALVIFVSFYQTPVVYQILYWRTGMIPYTLPLAFFAALTAWILRYLRQPCERTREIKMRVAVGFAIFFVSGLCETTSALLVGILFLAVAVTWWMFSKHRRKDVVVILALALFVAVVSLLIVAFSPGTASRLDRIMTEPPLYNPFKLGVQVVIYTAQFLWDNLKVTPLTIFITTVIPFAAVFIQSMVGEQPVRFSNRQILVAIAALLVLMFVAIGFSFAPSAFVGTYPVARARFASHYVMNLGVMLAGGMLGVIVSRMRMPIKPGIVTVLAVSLLGVVSVYPLYAAPKVSAALSENRTFAAAWDERDAYIRSEIASGATDLVVVQLDSVGGVTEYKGNPTDWVNRCAARYYGLNSIIAP